MEKSRPRFNYRTKAYFYLLIVSIIWGIAAPVIKFTLSWFDPFLFLSYRLAISSVIAVIILVYKKQKLPTKPKSLFNIFLFSITSVTFALGLLFLGLNQTSAVTGSIISLVGPLILVLGGTYFFHDHVTKKERFGILLALGGAMIIVFESMFTNKSMGTFLGNLLIIGATFSDKIAVLISKSSIRDKVKPVILTQVSFIIGFFTIIPLAAATGSFENGFKTIITAPLQAHFGVLYMAIISGSIGYFLFHHALKSVEVSEAAVFSYLQPVWAVLLAILWLKEELTIIHIISAVIISIGVFIAETKKRINKN
ncbi:DMT family transporter [Patescibacteria group bacterium]